MISKLTIVLTIKDREAFTLRWLRYLSLRCAGIHLVIADSSVNETFSSAMIGTSFPAISFEYFRVPPEGNMSEYYKKLGKALSKVKSEYLLLADDDDFIMVEKANEIIKFLDNNRDYLGARGRSVGFYLYDSLGNVKNSSQGNYYYAFYNDYISIESSLPSERINEFSNNTFLTDCYYNWYSIWRADPLRKAFSELIKFELTEPRLVEILLHLTMVMRGKLKVIDVSWYIRQEGTSMLGAPLNENQNFLSVCIKNDEFSKVYRYIDEMCKGFNMNVRDVYLLSLGNWVRDLVLSQSKPSPNVFKSFLKRIAVILYLRMGNMKFLCVLMNAAVCVCQMIGVIPRSMNRRRIFVPDIESYILK